MKIIKSQSSLSLTINRVWFVVFFFSKYDEKYVLGNSHKLASCGNFSLDYHIYISWRGCSTVYAALVMRLLRHCITQGG